MQLDLTAAVREIDRVLAALVDVKPLADYGVVGTYDTVQARRQRALARAEQALLNLRRDLAGASGVQPSQAPSQHPDTAMLDFLASIPEEVRLEVARLRAASGVRVRRGPLTKDEVDALVYQCRQAGDDSTYALVRAAEVALGVAVPAPGQPYTVNEKARAWDILAEKVRSYEVDSARSSRLDEMAKALAETRHRKQSKPWEKTSWTCARARVTSTGLHCPNEKCADCPNRASGVEASHGTTFSPSDADGKTQEKDAP